MRAPSRSARRSIARLLLVVATGALVAACRARLVVAPTTAVADPVQRAVATAVASLERGESIVVEGRSIVSTVVLPDFYRRRDFAIAWTRAAAVDDLLRAARDSADDGLEPADYHLATIERLSATRPRTPEARAGLDLLLTDAALLLAHDLRFGKAGPVTLDANPPRVPSVDAVDLANVLQRGLAERKVYETFDGLKPTYPFYSRLKAALADHRRIEAAGGWADLPAGGPLKPGAKDARVVPLRRRLGATGDLPAAAAADASREYDAQVEAAVQAFQERHGLKADGAAGATTLQALDVPVGVRIAQIRATLERCRWVMHDLPGRFVLVNVAGFNVMVIDTSGPVWESRVVVGERDTPTPIFRADMRSIVLNPTWTIPPGIMRKEINPAIAKDPKYIQRKGYTWKNGQLMQPAGPKNPLGRIKLLLPNPHHVYLHDTPSKAAFSKSTRTFSHGCVRVEKPFELAALALDDPAWPAESLLDAAANGKTRTLVLKRPLPVLIFYWTAAADPDGRVRFLPDVYQLDAALVRALAEPPGRRNAAVQSVDEEPAP